MNLQTFLFPGDFLAIGLDCRGAKQNYLDSTTNVARLQSFGLDAIAERRRPTILKKWDIFTNYVEENRQHIFYIFVFYVVTIALFIERFICKWYILLIFVHIYYYYILFDHNKKRWW